MKKRITKHFPFILTALFLVVICGIGSTLSYLTASDTTVNQFPVGNAESEIQEDFPAPTVEPGQTSKKEVKVTNTGNLPSFVRVRLKLSSPEAQELAVLEGIDETLWTYDGTSDFYYYKKIVNPGESTDNLITGVTFLAESENYKFSSLEDFNLTVYAELFQHYDHEGSCAEDEYLTTWERGTE